METATLSDQHTARHTLYAFFLQAKSVPASSSHAYISMAGLQSRDLCAILTASRCVAICARDRF